MTTYAPLRNLICTCCSGHIKGRQYHNQDTGYGLCPACADWIKGRGMSEQEMERTYGTKGVHWVDSETAFENGVAT